MLPANSGISPEELDEIAERQGAEVGEGDIVVVRTGRWQDFVARRDGEAWLNYSPGLSWRCAEWLHNRKAVAVACDNIAVEVLPNEIEGGFLAFHMITLRDMGLMLGEIWNLEALGRDCAEDGSYNSCSSHRPCRLPGARERRSIRSRSNRARSRPCG
jgi:kynurenine formamidase